MKGNARNLKNDQREGGTPSGKGFGRVTSATTHPMMGLFLMVWPIMFVHLFQHSCLRHGCSLSRSLGEWRNWVHECACVLTSVRSVSVRSVAYLLSWTVLQLVLYLVVPGAYHSGQKMPSGRTLEYRCNGLACFLVSNAVVLALAGAGLIEATFFVDHIVELLVLSNFCGLVLTLLIYLKGLFLPDDPADCFFSGSLFYDLYMGVEHSPRIFALDLKQFFNARTGIALWPLINLSYACKQYQLYGYVTLSMVVVNFLQGLYVLDLFLHEAWYLRTIDIAYDHFGYYLIWGDLAWLPFMYTLQGLYLVHNPVQPPLLFLITVVALGVTSMFLFRQSNNQKDKFRRHKHSNLPFLVHGKEADFVEATFTSLDGKKHKSYLLAGGYWGLSRHFNYLTDMVNALTYCLPCGFHHLHPYFYLVYTVVLLTHRAYRDDLRCREKYGHHWEKYCLKVPHKIVPYLY